MKKTIVTKLGTGKVVEVRYLLDGSVEILQEIDEMENCNDEHPMFVLIEASRLSMYDDFMQYEPRNLRERTFKNRLVEVIKKNIPDFYCAKLDPSFDDKEGIVLERFCEPAVGKSASWWSAKAKTFAPECNSRLGTRDEYIAFLGWLIKTLTDNGWGIKNAWDAVCNDSTELGHYWNSKNSEHKLERTGSREVCGFYDLGNTYKVISEGSESNGFKLAGASYNQLGHMCPLMSISNVFDEWYSFSTSVGWIVLEK